jgi:hypothetical protein
MNIISSYITSCQQIHIKRPQENFRGVAFVPCANPSFFLELFTYFCAIHHGMDGYPFEPGADNHFTNIKYVVERVAPFMVLRTIFKLFYISQ